MRCRRNGVQKQRQENTNLMVTNFQLERDNCDCNRRWISSSPHLETALSSIIMYPVKSLYFHFYFCYTVIHLLLKFSVLCSSLLITSAVRLIWPDRTVSAHPINWEHVSLPPYSFEPAVYLPSIISLPMTSSRFKVCANYNLVLQTIYLK
jgi:hypothetical protein